MPQKTNLNVNPYFDDFDSSKNFYKVLFRPGYSIQSRELTTLQSILQNQIESFGKYAFKQGQLVIPGEVGFTSKLDYVKLSSISEVAINVDGEIQYEKYDIKNLIGYDLIGINSGVIATVIEADYATDSDSDTIFVKYKTSGDATTESTFRQGETLEVVDGVNTPLLVVGTDGSAIPTTIPVTNLDTGVVSNLMSPAMGYASALKVEEGIYFVNGFFVRNKEEILIIDKYYDRPSAKVGFKIVESVVFPEEDSSLYDNAQGYSNYVSPGANRLKIDLELEKYSYNQITDKNFIELVKINSGVVEKQIQAADYNLIESTLARRTFDESGDYVVDDFSANIREYLQKDGNNGLYNLNPVTNTVNGISESEAESKMVLSMSPGKAYVKGYEIVNKETKFLEVDKARETLDQDNISIKGRGVSDFKITNVYNSIPLNSEGSELTAYPDVYFNSVFNDGSIGLNGSESVYKKTISRRGESYSYNDENITYQNEDIGILTIYLAKEQIENAGTEAQSGINFSNFVDVLSSYNTLYYRKSETLVSSVRTLAASTITRPEIGPGLFLELTVYGDKQDLYTYFREYNTLRLFTNTTDASNNTIQNSLGVIRDYNNIVTPLIGVSKPKNFYFKDYPVGFNSDTARVISKGTVGYDASFSYGYFNPVFFTKLTLESDIVRDTFTSGQYVTGSKSGAYGVVEGGVSSYSFGNQLFLKTLYGKFVQGETISDENNNIAVIATDNTISHFVVTQSAVGWQSNATNLLIDDVPYDISKVDLGIFNGNFTRVSVSNRDFFKQTYSTPPTIKVVAIGGGDEGTTPTQPTIIPVLFKNSVLEYSESNVKSLYSSFGSGNKNIFTADVDLNREKYVEINQVTAFTFSGKKGYKYLECNGFGDDANFYVKPGDLIQFTTTQNIVGAADTLPGQTSPEQVVTRALVQYTTISGRESRTRIYLDSALANDVINSSVVSLKPKRDNKTISTLVFPVGSDNIKSLVKDVTDSKFKYYMRRDFVVTASSSSGIITFAAQLPYGTQRFVSYTKENYIFSVLSPGNSNLVTGDILNINEEYVNIRTSTDSTSGLTSGSITITLPGDFFGSNVSEDFPVLKLTSTLETTKAKPRIKTSVRNKRIVVNSAGDKIIPLRGYDYDSQDAQIYSYSDVYKLKYVYVGGTNPPVVDLAGNIVSGTDVTDRYTFDDGQRDTFYDVSRLVLKPGINPPTGQLLIAFDYFDQSQGDFCTADSYIHEAGVSESDIPYFNSPIHGNLSLKNVIDFRPKVDSSTAITGYQGSSMLDSSNFISFIGPGGVSSSTPAIDSNLEYTMSFSQSEYLARIDAVSLTKDGKFVTKAGNASLNPSKPELIGDSIPLYYLYIPPYTKSSEDVKVIPVDNRRYTMRDIGKLEKRIERLEHYTTLSILEQQALNMQIKNNLGIDKFKLGFIVDNFESHKIGNFSSLDYKCSIDTQQSTLKPEVKEDCITIEEVNNSDNDRLLSGYVNNNGIITLPYENLAMNQNQFASKLINPNAFVVIQYAGDVNIYPQSDVWFDDETKPLVSNDNNGLFSLFSAKEDVSSAISSIYNNYSINWVGVDRTFYSIDPLTQLNSQSAIAKVDSASISSSSNITPQNYELGNGVDRKNVNNKVVLNSVQYFAKSQVIKYSVSRLKPKTQLYVFMEGVNIGRWTNPDSRFTGIPGNSLTSFGSTITTDENGNASGIIIIPSGYAPEQGSTWTNDLNSISYDTSGSELRFPSGIKTIRFTSSSTNENKSVVDTYADTQYYSVGILPQNPPSIVSTRPSQFKANEGVQYIDSNTDIEIKPNPIAQIFRVENYDGGVFATELDLFFNKKSSDIPIRVYLTNVDVGKPAKNIIPGTESYLNPHTKIRVYASGLLQLKIGELVNGSKSGASGPLLKVLDRTDTEMSVSATDVVTLNNQQIYTLVLSNHNGKEFLQNEILSTEFLSSNNNENATNTTLSIVKDSGKVSNLSIKSMGQNYDNALVTIESPQLPGGSTATANVRIDDGKIYFAELALSGSEYTENPAVVVRGIGTGSSGVEITSQIEITNPAVRMGVCVDDFDLFGVANSVTPTKFKFKYPVYLQNNTDYALVIETDSIDYKLWSSRLGESDVATNTTVVRQPGLGSLYKSQNIDNWTEDLFEDIKFTLHRAEFNIQNTGYLYMKEKSLGYEKLSGFAIETSALADPSASSMLFKNNNSILKIYHPNHGFEDNSNSYVFFDNSQSVGGITASTINSGLFKVMNSGLDTYNITVPYGAGSNTFGGGSNLVATYNRKYEKLYADVSYLQATGTNINSFVRTTNIIPVDSNTTNYKSYSVSDYERTFLNEEHYFINQKVVVSDINKTINDIDNSLSYRIELSSTSKHLSPVIDLSSASVKTVSSRVDKSHGQEDRFGKRYQRLSFYPVYSFILGLQSADSDIVDADSLVISDNQSVTGETSGASGKILKFENGRLFVKLTSVNPFESGETIRFSQDSDVGGSLQTTTVIINGAVQKYIQDFVVGSIVSAVYPLDTSIRYTNKVSGQVVYWDQQFNELIIDNNKQPINNNYNSVITPDSDFTRATTFDSQSSDIFRVGDILYKSGLSDEDSKFIEIQSMTFDNGIDFSPETDSKNTSSLAKYLTKEISLVDSATSIDARLTVSVKEIENVKVFYKVKNASSQDNFEDISWKAFNIDGNPDSDQIATSSNSISGDFENQKVYQELKFSASNLTEFSSFAIKIVMNTDNPVYSPKIQDLRVVASY